MKRKPKAKDYLIGVLLILISNIIYIGNGYLVKWQKLQAPEVALLRGVIQVMIFGTVLFCRSWKESQENKGKFTPSAVFYLVLYGFSISSISFTFLAAIPYMPLGDLIVLGFTS